MDFAEKVLPVNRNHKNLYNNDKMVESFEILSKYSSVKLKNIILFLYNNNMF